MYKLIDISEICVGYKLRGATKAGQQTVFMVSAKDLTTGFVEVSKVIIPKSFNNYLQDGDVLVKARGASYEAKVFRRLSQEYPYIASDTLLVVRLKTADYEPAYIAQVISSERSQQFLHSLSSGATISILSPSSLGSLPCPRISLREQERLEDMTKTIDEYCAALAQYQKAGEQLTEAIKQQFMKGVKTCH